MNTKDLVTYLKSLDTVGASFMDRLKIAYRPYICPFDNLLLAIPEESSVFDIGCGSGMFLSLIRKFRNPLKIGGCEINEHLIENTKTLLKDYRSFDLFVFDGNTIPLEVKNYDTITMIDVFHHIPKSKQYSFLIQLFSKMKIGATFIIKDIRGESLLSYWNKFHDLLISGDIGHEPKSYELESFLTKTLKGELIEKNQKRMLLYPHFTLVIKKVK